MLTQLGGIEAACGAWQEANDGEEARDQTEQARQKTIETHEVPKGGDTRSKASRRHAVMMLLPRVRFEIQDLHSGRWVQGLGLSDSVSTGKGEENSGQINKVQELHYSTESGELSGYFKSE